MAGKKCCCGCCSLRDGTKIIAILFILSGVSNFFTSISNLTKLISYDSNDVKAVTSTTSHHGNVDGNNNKDFDEYLIEYKNAFMVYFGFEILRSIIIIILSGLLLQGAIKEQVSKCKHWFYFNAFSFAVILILLVGFLIMLMINTGSIGLGLFIGLLLAIPLGFHAYMLKVVYDYICELRETGDGGVSGGRVFKP